MSDDAMHVIRLTPDGRRAARLLREQGISAYPEDDHEDNSPYAESRDIGPDDRGV